MDATENAPSGMTEIERLRREIASLVDINAELVADVSERDEAIGRLRGVVEHFREILVGQDVDPVDATEEVYASKMPYVLTVGVASHEQVEAANAEETE